jgi:hypothetical protein
MNKIKITIQFEDFVIPDKEIMMPCVPAVGSWITFIAYPNDANGNSVFCTEFRVTYVNYMITLLDEVSKIYVSVCKNTMINENGN